MTIGIPTRNRYDRLANCLKSLEAQTHQDFEVIVIDDSDSPGNLPPVLTDTLSRLTVSGHAPRVLAGKRKGPHYCHQMILDNASAPLVWRIDDDCVAFPDVCAKLVALMDSDPRIGAVGPLALIPGYGEGRVLSDTEKLGKVGPDGGTDGVLQWHRHASPNPKPVEHLHCTFMYRRDAMRQVGGWFLGYSRAGHREETDSTYRLFRAGWKLFVLPSAVVMHHRAPAGGIRDVPPADYVADDALWKQRFAAMQTGDVVIVIDGGIGDHIEAMPTVLELLKRHPKARLHPCYGFVYEALGVPVLPYSALKKGTPWTTAYTGNVYEWAAKRGYTGPLKDAWARMHLGTTAPAASPVWAEESPPADREVPGNFVLISPYGANNLAKPRTAGAKNWLVREWEKVIASIDLPVIQIGRSTESRIPGAIFMPDLSFRQVVWLLRRCEFFIGVDNFVQHLGASLHKAGVVLFTCSDYRLFGHPEHINIFGTRKCSQECHGGMTVGHQWWTHDRPCNHGAVCAKTISSETVLKLVEKRWPGAVRSPNSQPTPPAVVVPRKISIVIPTYNKLEECLKPCLASVLAHSPDTVEVIVVANGCTDDTKKYLESQRRVRMLWSDSPMGFAPAVNLGLRNATGDVMIALNNDIKVLGTGWLDLLVRPFREPGIGITGPLKLLSPITQRRFIVGFCMAVRREVFQRIGYLDERFPVGGCEDIDFCYRAENAGYRLLQVPSDDPLTAREGTHVSTFPIYHTAEATVLDPALVTGWKERMAANEELLRQKLAAMEPPRPFLSVVTRAHMRPVQLLRCLESLAVQTDKDFENVLVVDIGKGQDLHRANRLMMENAPRVRGRYVWMLDDDDVASDADVVAKVHEAAKGDPAVIVAKMRHIGGRILPEDTLWRQRPVQGHIGGSNIIVRADVWRRYVKTFGTTGYVSDYRMIEEMWKSGLEFVWLDHVIVTVPHQHFGAIGE